MIRIHHTSSTHQNRNGGNEQNWLLDIQLYSERFENSRVSDVKAEIGIEGYDLDPFLTTHQKFFANKKRASSFKKIYEIGMERRRVYQGNALCPFECLCS